MFFVGTRIKPEFGKCKRQHYRSNMQGAEANYLFQDCRD